MKRTKSKVVSMIPGKSLDCQAGRTFLFRFTHDHSIIVAAFLVALFGFCFGEKIPIGNGFGWDGQVYGGYAKNWTDELAEKPLDQYTIRRILPSVIVHLAMRFVGCELSDVNVICGFGVLNILCITGVAWYWVRIARLLGIGTCGKWLGFCALVLNFAVAKHTSYYPVLTDIPAYAIGCGMLYYYLRRNSWGLYLLATLGAFVWPMLLMQGTLLLLFPRDTNLSRIDLYGSRPRMRHSPKVRSRGLRWNIDDCVVKQGGNSIEMVSNRTARSIGLRPPSQQTSPGNYIVAGIVAYYFLLAANWSLQHAHLPICGYIDPVMSVLPLSQAIAAAYVFFVVLQLVDVPRFAREIVSRLARDWQRMAAVLVFVGAIQFVYASWAPLPGHSNGRVYVMRLMIKAVFKPGAFMLGHAVYFGPVVPLALLLWRQVSCTIRTIGLGLSLTIVLALLLSLDGESRHLVHAFPLIVPFVVLAAQRVNWGRGQVALFAALSVFASKTWYTINGQNMEQGASLLEYPLQGYAMNYGVFMTTESFLIQGAIACAFTWALHVSLQALKPGNVRIPVNSSRERDAEESDVSMTMPPHFISRKAALQHFAQ